MTCVGQEEETDPRGTSVSTRKGEVEVGTTVRDPDRDSCTDHLETTPLLIPRSHVPPTYTTYFLSRESQGSPILRSTNTQIVSCATPFSKVFLNKSGGARSSFQRGD